MDLTKMKCIPCTGKEKPFNRIQSEELLKKIKGWGLTDQGWLVREFKFKDFKESMGFVEHVAKIAERENHHPDIHIYSWNRLRLELYTHAIKGLSQNDFIVAAKINELYKILKGK